MAPVVVLIVHEVHRAAALGLATTPIAAAAVSRENAPVDRENGLGGQGTLFMLGVIAVVALAVVLLPEDEPASP